MNTFNSLDDTQIYSFPNITSELDSFPSSLNLQSYSTYQPSLTSLDLTDDQSAPKSSKISKGSKKILKEIKFSRSSSDDSICTSTTPGKKPRNFWTPIEDDKLLQLIQIHGSKWSLIGELIGSKSCKQVRDRYLNFVRPNINNGPFTSEEDALLLSLYKKLGKKWKNIGDHMPGRTEIQVKNRFYRHIGKKMLGDGKSNCIETSLKRALSIYSQTTSSDFDEAGQEERLLNVNSSYALTKMQEELAQEEIQADSLEDIFYQLNFGSLNYSKDLLELDRF